MGVVILQGLASYRGHGFQPWPEIAKRRIGTTKGVP
jgi:hypothetical protein